RDVDVGRCRDLTGDDGHAGRDQRFAGHPRIRIFDQNGIEHRVGDLIGDLVGVPFRDRLGSEDVAMSWHVFESLKVQATGAPSGGQPRVGIEQCWIHHCFCQCKSQDVAARSAERAASAASAAARACAVVTCRISHLMIGSAGGPTESVSYPSPSKRNAETGSEAISPQTLAGLPAARAASATSLSRRRTLGSCGVKRSARRALPRSTTSVYCVRSLVPTLRKSLTSARRSAITAAAGVSTMTPRGTVLAAGMPLFSRR